MRPYMKFDEGKLYIQYIRLIDHSKTKLIWVAPWFWPEIDKFQKSPPLVTAAGGSLSFQAFNEKGVAETHVTSHNSQRYTISED